MQVQVQVQCSEANQIRVDFERRIVVYLCGTGHIVDVDVERRRRQGRAGGSLKQRKCRRKRRVLVDGGHLEGDLILLCILRSPTALFGLKLPLAAILQGGGMASSLHNTPPPPELGVEEIAASPNGP